MAVSNSPMLKEVKDLETDKTGVRACREKK